MPPRKPTAEEVKAAQMMQDVFASTEFETVYEGLGTTWDFTVHPVFVGYFQRYEETEQFKYGSKTEKEMRPVWTFKGPDGELYAIWGSFSLERGLRDVKFDDLVRITYNGKNTIGETNREVKDFKIEFAK